MNADTHKLDSTICHFGWRLQTRLGSAWILTLSSILIVMLLSPVIFIWGCSSSAENQGREQFKLAQYYFEQKQFERAVPLYQEVLDKQQDDPPTDEALYRLADSLQRLGRWADADRYLSKCFNDFSTSPWGPPARHRFGARIWRLRWGMFEELGQATELVSQLARLDISANWSPLRFNGNLLYAVHSGRYDNYAQAQEAFEQSRTEQRYAEIVAAAARELPGRQDK